MYLDGFPDKPLTIESAELCDEKKNVIYKDSWTCKEDTTCKQCKQQYITEFKDLNSAFNDIESKAKREVEFLEKFKDVPYDMISVLGVNYGQLYLLLNWACALQSMGIDPTSFSVIVPTDKESYAVVSEMGFHTIDVSWVDRLSNKISSTYRGSAMSGGHAKINNVILMVANELVQLNFRVILHDVDIAWTTDIRSYLVDAGARRDILGMIAPYWVAKGTINTGFVVVMPTVKSKILMQSLVNIAPLKKVSDQVLWNTVLRHHKFMQLGIRILPQKVFYKYSGHSAQPPNNDMILFHSVGNDKQTHLDYFGLWFFKQSCSYFSLKVDNDWRKVKQITLEEYKKKNHKP